MNIVSFNVARGIAGPILPRYLPRARIVRNLERMGEALRASQADVALLQEVPSPRLVGRGVRPLEILSVRSAMPNAYFSDADDVHTAILTREPGHDSSAAQFSPAESGKGYTIVTVDGVRVVSVHLAAFLPARRRLHVEGLCRDIEALPAPSGGLSLVIGGDFNDATGKCAGEVSRRLELRAALALATFPAILPVVQLDWLLVSHALSVVHHAVLPGAASDHRPVLVRVSSNDAASPG